MSDNQIREERPEPKYYSRIPKMATIDLDPYELALYCNYKQTTSDGDGIAWKSNKTLAKECNMSPRKVTDCRASLVKKGFIRVEYEKDEEDNIISTAVVTIIDIWQENIDRYTPKTPDSTPKHKVLTPQAHDATPIAPGAREEEPKNKNKNNKDIAPGDARQKPSSKDEPKARKRDILFDSIVEKGFNIDPAECSKEQLAAIAGRVGKIKSRLIKINPAFKEMSDEEIRSEIKSFWNWYKQLYDFSEAHLKSDVKWGEYYLQYHQSDKQDTTEPHNNVIAKRTMQKYHAEQERLKKLKGENQ